MQHDIYSLGVCLLEIGVGRSLICSVPDTALKPVPEPSIAADPSIKGLRKRAFETKRALVKMASEQLPPKKGRKFADTVVTCLTCLDKTQNSFGDEKDFFDEMGSSWGFVSLRRWVSNDDRLPASKANESKILTALLDFRI